jgi:hypothetical protein
MRLSARRSIAVTLALCAMVLRALLPDGWMPAASGATLVICSIDGVHTGGGLPSDPAQEHSHAPCAFAAAAHLAPPDLGRLSLAQPTDSDRVDFAPVCQRTTCARPYRPGAARAPPAFS